MTGIQTINQKKEQQLGPVVWILQGGERDEGGDIIGVFLDRDLARGQFLTAAEGIHRNRGTHNLYEDENGAIRFEDGCDWLSLEPHTVTTALELDA